ncbi:G protein-activated inward rectifier potassium channel 3 [Nilaparvata lugens]|uniref:G protein-activated inward rectifier potassium channel 3 n=1 Tax=Nilaparvata lugens TaxID=108931 RepID=UPI00193DFB4C|nr:G protein-activated inward rectifier potassium channel 3 [Nilaparvata lugens]
MEAATRWEQLISSTLTPTTAVAVKLAVTPDQDENDVTGPADHQHKTQNGGLLGSLRHLPGISRFTSSTNSEQRSPLFRYRQTRFSSRRVRRRVVFKHGDCNVVQGNVAKRRRKYLQDIFTTLVDAQWRWTLLVFAMNFFLSWLGFAIIWWLIVFWHGDLEPTAQANSSWVPCVRDVNTFTSCFLFSVETQHTIGQCIEKSSTSKINSENENHWFLRRFAQITNSNLFLNLYYSILFLFILIVSILLQRDGQLCLMFRVGDMRKSHIIEAHVRAQLIKKKVTREGEVLPFYQQELKVGGDGEEDKIFFIWPTTIVHKITPSSPLYNLSASDMLRERFEIVVILEGVIESTGMTTQARSSYLPNEILWGHRFEPLVSFKKETGEHEVDYNLFNNTYEVDTPLCSAQSLDRVIGLHQHNSDLQKYGISTTTNTSLESNSLSDSNRGDSNHNHNNGNQDCVVEMQHVMLHPHQLPGPESRI